MTAEDKRRDAYYRRKYGISLDDYERMDFIQNRVCAICHRPPTKNRLAVDHWHGWKYVKLNTTRVGSEWLSVAYENQAKEISWAGKTKSEAIRGLRKMLQKKSVRGLLCFSCNSGLRKYADDPNRFEAAAEYLRRWEKW